MFVDIVEIKVKGGNGGRGIVSFRREKFVPFGGPSGGDGGDGGSIILMAEERQHTLVRFKGRKLIVAQNGSAGGSNKKSGKGGDDKLVVVPVGTVVYEKIGNDKVLFADMGIENERLVVAKGGKGGKGNARFATSTRQAPEIAEAGEQGEERELILELKIIADVGIIGKPNAGKSTLITAATRARPKIASYPFTTTVPVLGVVDVGWGEFIMAEIPGLIEGAHLGRGLGREFLKHAERTKLLLHIVDGSSPTLVEDWLQVNKEVFLYSPRMAAKEQIAVINKIDITFVREDLLNIKEQIGMVHKEVYFISAATGEGIPELMKIIAKKLTDIEVRGEEEKPPTKIFRPHPVDIRKN